MYPGHPTCIIVELSTCILHESSSRAVYSQDCAMCNPLQVQLNHQPSSFRPTEWIWLDRPASRLHVRHPPAWPGAQQLHRYGIEKHHNLCLSLSLYTTWWRSSVLTQYIMHNYAYIHTNVFLFTRSLLGTIPAYCYAQRVLVL